MSKSLQISRRQFLGYGVVSTAGLLLPNLAPAAPMGMMSLLRLHPVRFLVGLVFSIAKAVVVKFASDAIVHALYGKSYSRLEAHRRYGAQLASCGKNQCNDQPFRHVNYKASVITLGVADYRQHEQRQLAILLQDKNHLNHYQTILEYLRDEKIRVKLANMEYSQKVGAFTEPDDLFTLDYMLMEKHQQAHYRHLIEYTQTTAFKHWSV